MRVLLREHPLFVPVAGAERSDVWPRQARLRRLRGRVLAEKRRALVTAVALFFSTFSTPLLSAALTFGLYVIGHFNAGFVRQDFTGAMAAVAIPELRHTPSVRLENACGRLKRRG